MSYSDLLKEHMQRDSVDFIGEVDFNRHDHQRFKLADGSRKDERVWVRVHDDKEGASYGNWGESDKMIGVWRSDIERHMPPAELDKHRAARFTSTLAQMAKERMDRDSSYAKCMYIYENCKEAPADHPYLVKKRLSHKGVRWYGGELVFPMANVHGYFRTFHRIMRDGSKKFSWALSPDNAFIHLGDPIGSVARLCEGWATGMAILEAVGGTVLCAVPCGNVPKVAADVAREYPMLDIIICPDNDQWKAMEIDSRTGKRKKNSGLYYAKIASEIDNFPICYPTFKGLDVSGQPTDWHDLKMLGGIDEVRKQLLNVSG